MKPKENLKLREELFKKHWSLEECYLSFGFECGDGWLPIIDELATEVEKLIEEEYPHSTDFMFVQIKEKCGTLRCYTGVAPKAAYDLIGKYEEKSGTICEYCGSSGRLRYDLPWVSTLCDDCYTKRLHRK